jgi:hypothetical protein
MSSATSSLFDEAGEITRSRIPEVRNPHFLNTRLLIAHTLF